MKKATRNDELLFLENADPLGRLIYHLITSKRPKKNEGENKLIVWQLRFITGILLSRLNKKYYDFWRWSTRYYPFSLLFKDRLFHYKNIPVKKFMIGLEKIIKKAKLRTNISNGEQGELITTFYGTFDYEVDKTTANIKRIERVLQAKFGSIIAREFEVGFKILMPTELLYNLKVIK